MGELEPYDPYARQPEEPLDAYELFTEWCKVPPSSRTLANLSLRTSIPSRKLKRLHDSWDWRNRVAAFDNDALRLKPDPTTLDQEASQAAQLAASAILLDIGLTSIQLKDPSLISAKTAAELVKSAVEMQRKALGEADMNIKFTGDDMNNVNELMSEIFELEQENAVEAEIVEDEGGD